MRGQVLKQFSKLLILFLNMLVFFMIIQIMISITNSRNRATLNDSSGKRHKL